MTETQPRTERTPVRPRSGRRPIPPLIFLLALALVALGVWWDVLRDDAERRANEAAACTTAEAAPPSLDPASVTVRVLNSTDRAGAAGLVAEQLRQRGFVVAEVGNDSSDREVTGPAELRFGQRGRDAARFLGLLVPGASTYLDTRADARVDLVIGPELVFEGQTAALASPEEVEAALASAASASAAAC